MKKVRIGVIGFGRMGSMFLEEMKKIELLDIIYICDMSPLARSEAAEKYPDAQVIEDEDIIFNDPSVDAVGLFALADSRAEQIEKAAKAGKHIIAEKPIGATREDEKRVLRTIEGAPIISTVNMYLNNAWYNKLMKSYIAEGEIGELAIIRICHMTPGLAPGEGHEAEGPCFHDCGMHYVNIARWFAESEYKTWHAQGMRMWSYKDPWWVQAHGTFESGVVFDITQGFVYGQLSKNQTHNSYVDIIGTKGIVRMTHDFKTAVVELRGVTRTERVEKPFGGKNIDILCRLFAESVISGERSPLMPTFKDSAVASEFAWIFLEDAMKDELPAIGNEGTLEEIRERRRNMTDGYGLLPRR